MRALSFQRLLAGFIEDFQSRKFGKYAGTVSNVDDPENMGRIRATVPRVLKGEETRWALPCSPYAGPDAGLFTVPPVGAGVWIEFEEGHVDRPIWTGCWWPRGDAPEPEEGQKGRQATKTLKSDNGLNVALDDDSEAIVISDSGGQNKMTVFSRQGQIEIEASGKIQINAGQIDLIQNARHPLVFGDDLLIYLIQIVTMFNVHTHPAQTVLGIPVTPAPPLPQQPLAQQTMLSTRVKTN